MNDPHSAVLCQCGQIFASQWALSSHRRTCRRASILRKRSSSELPAVGGPPKLINGSGIDGGALVATVADAPRRVLLSRKLPREAGGNGPRRLMDNAIFVPPSASDIDEPDCVGRLHFPIERSRKEVEYVAKAAYSLVTSAGTQIAMGAPFPPDTALPTSDEIQPIPCGVDCAETLEPAEFNVENATASELAHAARELIVQIGNKAGAHLTNRFLKVITHENWRPPLLSSEGGDTFEKARDRADRELEESAHACGFQTVYLENPVCPELPVKMLLRDPVGVLIRQLSKAKGPARNRQTTTPGDEQNFFFRPVTATDRLGRKVLGHPMGASIAEEVIPIIEKAIKSGARQAVFWRPGMSFVLLIQLYSDKSALSLKSSSLTFYPLHLSIQNFFEAARKDIIARGESVVGYFPVNTSWPTQGSKSGLDETIEHLTVFQAALEMALSKLRDQSEEGIPFSDADGKLRRAHCIVTSYTTDTPEGTAVCGTIGGYCTRCEIPKRDMRKIGYCGVLRNGGRATWLRDQVSGEKKKEVKHYLLENLRSSGYTMSLPFMSTWPFADLHPWLDMYNLIRFEMMHCLPLGLGKTVLNLISDRQRSKDLRTTRYYDSLKRARTFFSCRVKLLSEVDNWLAAVQSSSPAVGFNVDFSRAKSGKVLNGLFVDAGVASMMEAKEMKCAQQLFPFIGAFLDHLNGENSLAPLTKCLVAYTEMYRALSRKDNAEPGFSQDDIAALQTLIRKFKTITYNTFESWQKSSFCFPKWHALEHVVDDIKQLGPLSAMSADDYEASHKSFKNAHRRTSMRKSSALEDTTALLAREQATRGLMEDESHRPEGQMVKLLISGRNTGAGSATKSKRDAVDGDSACFSQRGEIVTWRQLVKAQQSALSKDDKLAAEFSGATGAARTAQMFVRSVGGGGLTKKVLSILRDKACGRAAGIEAEFVLNGLRMEIVKSAHIAGFPTPHLGDQSQAEVAIEDDGTRSVQRIISSLSFGGREKPFQDNVLLEARKGNPMCVWFAKALCLFRVQAQREMFLISNGSEMVVIRYFEVVPEEELCVIDNVLGCVKLRWAIDEHDDPWVDIVPASTLRGRIHIVPANFDVPYQDLGRRDAHHATPPTLENDDPSWKERLFFVNRFKVSNYDAIYNTVDR